MTLQDALRQAAAQGVPRLDAQLLLGHLLGRPREWLIAHDTDLLSPEQAQAFGKLCAQRADDVPLAYLVGHKEFHGLRLAVSPATLVPRPDTEALVEWALEPLGVPPTGAVLDLGTGSGCIALALKSSRPTWTLTAIDQSADAIHQARANGAHLGLPVEWLTGSWFEPVLGRRFDLILSNPPYIAEADPHLEALRHEPQSALTSGLDGLDDLRSLVAQAPHHLNPGGWLLLEHGHDQAEAVAELLRQAGFHDIQHRTDLSGIRRCTGGRGPSGR
ncbi:peptide chain release factor N(5)-glutamine methyltransferase [Inhella gelatinilytica]|uniref:Release factor glutamine methyltransferase n=1 Tax=Inhella gelatinilytica TaxID=2795030 RepID=A0A931NDC9_9BURK|nr:peptide chain release factor N(5)-glutamine methyltransferase [Inhella gelatinilytica]MBH9552469.1 peptide chain release factor N(5)-glutamine methyltransferase [Inhella gelatinilytica]